MGDVPSVDAFLAAGAKLDAKDTCKRLGDEHMLGNWFLLGQQDDGRWAWRCGNCLEVRHSEKEGGGPDPIRVVALAET